MVVITWKEELTVLKNKPPPIFDCPDAFLLAGPS